MKVAVFGVGYVGLVTGTGLATFGHTVTCVDINQDVIDSLNDNILPIHEDGLSDLVSRNVSEGRLFFTTDATLAMRDVDVAMIAVGTPQSDDGSADLQYVFAVTQTIADTMRKYCAVVIKSTVPVGTSDRVRDLLTSKTSVQFDIVSNPEFLAEGRAVRDMLNPARIVVGAKQERAFTIMDELYNPLLRKGCALYKMSNHSAELSKYFSNVMLATRLALINNLALAAGAMRDGNIDDIINVLSSDPRIGPAFLRVGPGFGGSCFPKDVSAMRNIAQMMSVPDDILGATLESNRKQAEILVERVVRRLVHIDQPKIYVWGIAFKANTDDIRESPAIRVMQGLVDCGVRIVAYDPQAADAFRDTALGRSDSVHIVSHQYDESMRTCDALMILTEWDQFGVLDFSRLRDMLKRPCVFDLRNMILPHIAQMHGFVYHSIGRPPVNG